MGSDAGRYGLAIVGGAVGFFLGNPFLGFAVGSALGTALFPTKLDPARTEGPRIGDLRVQTSTYGRGIPILLGESVRVAGNLIWSTPRIETTHSSTQDVGGKGGGTTQEVTQTSYSYSVSCAIALCDTTGGEIISIRRMWGNGELIYNVASDADFESYLVSQDLASAVRIYTGSETQTADALITSYEGDAPGYRGIAYIVFDGLQLARFGNAPPNLELEVVLAGADGPAVAYMDANNQFGSIASVSAITPGGSLLTWWTTQASPYQGRFALVNPFTSQIVRDLAPVNLAAGVYAGGRQAAMNSRGDIWFMNAATSNRVNIWLAGSSPVETSSYTFTTRCWLDDQDRFIFGSTSGGVTRLWYVMPGETTPQALSGGFNSLVDVALGADGYAYASVSEGSGDGRIHKVSLADGSIALTSILFGGTVGNICVAGDGSVWHTTGYDGSSDFEVWRLAPDFQSRTKVYDYNGTFTGVSLPQPGRDWATGDVLFGVAGNVYRYAADGTLITNYSSTVRVYGVRTDPRYPERVYMDNQVGPTGGVNQFLASERLSSVSSSSVPLATVLTTLCARVGLQGSDLDVSSLTASVRGYAVSDRMSAADAIQPLLTGYMVDAFESAGKIKFVQRGAASVATISEDDMGAHLSSEARPEAQEEGRVEEGALPREIALSYLDVDADYQANTQYARRLSGRSTSDKAVSVALVLSADEARRAAEAMLYELWIARRTHDVPLSTKYTRIEPGDAVTLALSDASLEVRVIQKDEGQGLVKLKTVGYDASIYSQTVSGIGAPAPVDTLSALAAAGLVMLDTALLQSADDDYGAYVAASALAATDSWPGGKLFKSSDDITYTDAGQAWSSAAVVGYATTRLGVFGGGNIFDEGVAKVTVSLISGELSSTTEANVLAGANIAWLGGEIIQFKNATLVDTQTYQLTGLLRGRLGTLWAVPRHKVGETFVLLTTSGLRSITTASGEVGSLRYYKGVTFGTSVLNAPAQSFTLAANRLRSVAPGWLGGGRNNSNDLIINWHRSARGPVSWNDAVDVPLDETTESYELDVFAGTTKTITAISQASDGVITSAAHGYSVGNVIYITAVAGMTPMNDRAYTIATVPTANAYTVGENTAGYAAYTSGGTSRLRGRTISVSSAQTTTYTSAQQTTDYGSAQNPIYVSGQQMSARVGRGYAAAVAL